MVQILKSSQYVTLVVSAICSLTTPGSLLSIWEIIMKDKLLLLGMILNTLSSVFLDAKHLYEALMSVCMYVCLDFLKIFKSIFSEV